LCAVHVGNVPVRFLVRHPIALLLAGAVLWSARSAVPPVVDAVTWAAPGGDVELVRPPGYVLAAPLSNVLDALTFLSVPRAKALVGTCVAALAIAGLLRHGGVRRRLTRAALWPLGFVGLAAAAVFLPRPVPRLVRADPAAAVIDYHAHTRASHDGRWDWSTGRVAWWHARQGFTATYVTDHNQVFGGSDEAAIPLLPGVEWSLYRLHLLAIGPVRELDRARYSGTLDGLLGVFAELHAQGALAIGSIPEYWSNHRENLDRFAIEGIDGFEIVNCSPKAIALDSAARADVVRLAARHDLLVVGASDSHGWGMVTCVWNLTVPGLRGMPANRVLARPLALWQDREPAWAAAPSQAWGMLRTLTWAERISWLTWIALITIYRTVPRRQDQGAGLGILARSLGRTRRRA
jgi:hypothetical protein